MIDLVISQRRKDLGGFEIGRLLPFAQRRMVGPFIFFDHMGPANLPAGISKTMDVRPHPHIGLSTVTYLFEGEIMHRDSVGSEQAILPGEMNWMIAGGGITHSERFERIRAEGGALHGIQAWVALPQEFEETAPAFFHHSLSDLPTFDSKGSSGRLIAGEAFGLKANVKVHSPIFYAHVSMEAGAITELPADYSERAAYVATGAVEIDGQTIFAGNMAVFAPGHAVKLKAETASIVMLLGGEPVGPRFIDWNFVSTSKDRIEQAKADWKAQRMKLPDLDNGEFTPLPEARS
jgi:redox-sensitive bicupin YhaK (pirin superfamily)